MNVLLFIVVVFISFVIVRIGAIAFQMTGLEWSLAKFQALSCFSTTGFTTREAELITSDPRRRKIATTLIILGNAGLITLIATFANSLRPWNIVEQLEIPWLSKFFLKGASLWINLAVILVALYVLYRLLTHPRLTHMLTDHLRRYLHKKRFIAPSHIEEMALGPQGHVISKCRITEDSSLANKELGELDLDPHNITALAVIRAETTIAQPSPRERLLPGDDLICFGVSSAIHKVLSPASQHHGNFGSSDRSRNSRP